MTTGPIEHLFTLQRSPIALAPVIHQFFANSQPRERDLLLSYLVLPMVLYPVMQEYLLVIPPFLRGARSSATRPWPAAALG